MRQEVLIRTLKLGSALGLAVVAMEGAVMAYPPLAGVLRWLRSPSRDQCDLAETVRSAAYHREFKRTHEQIVRSARLVGQDGSLQLWDVPGMRQFWIHGRFDRLSAFAFAEQAAGEYRHPLVHFNRGDIVLDIGADYGSVTFGALRAGAAKVVAVEIAPYKWPCLERTFAREISEGRVVLIRAGAWDSEDSVELGGDSVVLDRSSVKQKVRVTTIDRMVAELKLPRVDFISMDIEGAEKPALRGAANTLRQFRPRMAIASEHLPDDVTAIPETVRAMVPGYQVICGQCDLRNDELAAQVLWFK